MLRQCTLWLIKGNKLVSISHDINTDIIYLGSVWKPLTGTYKMQKLIERPNNSLRMTALVFNRRHQVPSQNYDVLTKPLHCKDHVPFCILFLTRLMKWICSLFVPSHHRCHCSLKINTRIYNIQAINETFQCFRL